MVTVQEAERLKSLKAFREATRQFHCVYDNLLAKYPLDWVAVDRTGDVVATGPDRQKVVAASVAAGCDDSRLAIKYLGLNPVPIIP